MKTITASNRTRFPGFHDLPKEYTALCGLYLPRPIRTATESKAATVVVETMAGHSLNRDQDDYLEAVSHFLDEYDRKHRSSLPEPDGTSVLKHLLDEHGMSGAALSRVLGGSRTLGPMILRGNRRLTLDHVHTLAEHFSVKPAVFL